MKQSANKIYAIFEKQVISMLQKDCICFIVPINSVPIYKGNNPMVGCTVATAVAVEEAMNKQSILKALEHFKRIEVLI